MNVGGDAQQPGAPTYEWSASDAWWHIIRCDTVSSRAGNIRWSEPRKEMNLSADSYASHARAPRLRFWPRLFISCVQSILKAHRPVLLTLSASRKTEVSVAAPKAHCAVVTLERATTTSRGGSDCVTMLAAIAGNKCRFCAEEIITAHTCAALAADSVQSGGGSCGVEFAAAPRTCVANCTSRPAYVSVLSVGLEGSSVASLMYDASVDRCVDNLLTISPRVLFFAAAGCAKEAGHT